ncbi:MAG: HisA/HisF-related TIM barrel protein, partial [Candidatus Bathyarchaeia archaeon]
ARTRRNPCSGRSGSRATRAGRARLLASLPALPRDRHKDNVYELYEKMSLPIIGCGGITSWQDVVEYLLAGASAVQIGSALINRDLGIFKEITEGLGAYLSQHGYAKLDEIIGTAHV